MGRAPFYARKNKSVTDQQNHIIKKKTILGLLIPSEPNMANMKFPALHPIRIGSSITCHK
jgi:hypothetical protein